MKIWKSKILKQMIIIITLIFVVLNCLVPPQVYATKSQDNIIDNFFGKISGTVGSVVGFSTSISGESDHSWGNIPGNLLKELIQLIVSLGDVIVSAMQVTLLGDMDFWVSTMISNKNDNLDDKSSWLYADQTDVDALQNGDSTDRGSMLVMVADSGLKNGIFTQHWTVPNILYTPENIFSNKIAALDANYINPHTYQPVNDSEESEREAESLASSISPTIASWYRAFRNIAIVGLLSVLVYIGIRIVIGTVSEKAKYKERLQDWFMALCLVFFMHFIMAGIMMLADQITNLLDSAINSGVIVAVDDGTIFRTNFTGYIRFASQSNSWTEALGYGIMYLVIIGLTLKFTFVYLKRALYLAFFTMIAPLVALTYPIDKVSDGKAQAFNMWIKEYFINAILQPIHLVLYCALIGAAMSLVVKNPIYGIVALLFISTAEKWIKRMFKMDRAELTSTSLGDVAMLGGMLSMGKNIAGGIAKTGVAIAGTVATGGIGAVGSAIGATKGVGMFKAGLGLAGKAASGIAGALGGGGDDSTSNNGENGSLPSGSAEDVASEAQYKDEVKQMADQQEKMKKESEERATKAMNAAKTNPNINNPNNVQRNATGGNMVSVNQDNVQNFDEMSGNDEKEDTDKKETAKKESETDKYYRHKSTIEELTGSKNDNKYQKQLTELLDQGTAGLAGGILSAPLGIIGVGALSDAKVAPTVMMGGATAFANLGDNITEISKTKKEMINNNISTLVKTDQVTDKDIIKGAAQVAVNEKWSEDKMKIVAPLAQKAPNLKGNEELQKQVKEQLKQLGVADKNIDQAIKDIIKVQDKAKELGKKVSDPKDTNVRDWK